MSDDSTTEARQREEELARTVAKLNEEQAREYRTRIQEVVERDGTTTHQERLAVANRLLEPTPANQPPLQPADGANYAEPTRPVLAVQQPILTPSWESQTQWRPASQQMPAHEAQQPQPQQEAPPAPAKDAAPAAPLRQARPDAQPDRYAALREFDTKEKEPAAHVLADQQKQSAEQEAAKGGTTLTADQKANASPEAKLTAESKEREDKSAAHGEPPLTKEQQTDQLIMQAMSGKGRDGNSGRGR